MGTRALANPTALSLLTNPTTTTHLRSCRYASNTTRNSMAKFENLVKFRCKSRDFSVPEALGLFDSMLAMNPMPSAWALNHLFGSLSDLNQSSTVVSMYIQLTRSRPVDFRPDVSTLTIVIRCLCQSNRAGLGFSVLGTMVKAGIRFDSQTVNTLLDGLCKEGSTAAAVDLFEMADSETGLCDEFTYGTIFNLLCNSGEPQNALALLRPRHALCFNAAVVRLCKSGLVNEALGLFAKMAGSEVTPSTASYNSLIHGLCRLGRHGEAAKLFAAMKSPPDIRTFDILIRALCEDGKVDVALRLFEEIASAGGEGGGGGVAPDVVCYNTIIGGLSKSGRWKEAARVLEDMKAKGVRADVATFCVVLDARFKEGNTVAALRLVGSLPDFVGSGFGLKCHGLEGLGRTEEAEILLGNMEGAAEVFSHTRALNVLLNGLSAGFMVLEARRLLEAMVERGKADTVSFTTVVNGYCLQGEMDSAEEVFRWMAARGFPPDAFTYSTLANGYLKAGRVGDSLGTLKGLVVAGLRPNSFARNILTSIKILRFYSQQQEVLDNLSTNVL